LTFLDVEANSFEHAGFSRVDGVGEAVNAGKVLAVGVILTVLLFDAYRII
jgi:hypothetical protein